MMPREENWDFESGEKRDGTPRARAVVSVAFQRSDFEHVAERAERSGKKVSKFIREAALEKAVRRRQMISLSSFSGSHGFTLITEQPLASTVGGHTIMISMRASSL